MRILHFADLHIGVENYGRVDPRTGLSTRLGDFLRAYDDIVDYAIDARVDLVLFCGDAYKSRDPSQTHQREFARRVARLSAAGIPVFLLVGNHDSPNVNAHATALEIFPTLDVANTHIGGRLDTYQVQTNAGPLQIVALPWIRRGDFMASGDVRGMDHEQINKAIESRIETAIALHAESLDADIPAVFAGHVTVTQARLASEQSMMLGHDHKLTGSSVALPQFDYVALGHIHRHQVLARTASGLPRMAYAGSPQRVDFGEEKDDKGFCVIELDVAARQGERLRNFEFVKIDARRFVTVSARVTAADTDPTASVVKAIERADVADAVVRVRVAMPSEAEARLRGADIRKALSGAHYVASVTHEITDARRARIGDADARSLTPQQALRLYCDVHGIAPERAETLMRSAEDLIAEQN